MEYLNLEQFTQDRGIKPGYSTFSFVLKDAAGNKEYKTSFLIRNNYAQTIQKTLTRIHPVYAESPAPTGDEQIPLELPRS